MPTKPQGAHGPVSTCLAVLAAGGTVIVVVVGILFNLMGQGTVTQAEFLGLCVLGSIVVTMGMLLYAWQQGVTRGESIMSSEIYKATERQVSCAREKRRAAEEEAAATSRAAEQKVLEATQAAHRLVLEATNAAAMRVSEADRKVAEEHARSHQVLDDARSLREATIAKLVTFDELAIARMEVHGLREKLYAAATVGRFPQEWFDDYVNRRIAMIEERERQWTGRSKMGGITLLELVEHQRGLCGDPAKCHNRKVKNKGCGSYLYAFPPMAVEFDHVIPRSMGGDDSFQNLQALCRSCNNDWRDRVEPNTEVWGDRQHSENVPMNEPLMTADETPFEETAKNSLRMYEAQVQWLEARPTYVDYLRHIGKLREALALAVLQEEGWIQTYHDAGLNLQDAAHEAEAHLFLPTLQEIPVLPEERAPWGQPEDDEWPQPSFDFEKENGREEV